jgi:ABC-type transport system involved in cytochrome c biogenesis permease subunit
MTAFIGCMCIALAAAVQAFFLLRREAGRDPVSHWMLAAAFLLLAATLVERSIRIGFVAVTSMYESLVFLSAAICAVIFGLRMARPARGVPPVVLFGATIICLALLLVSSSPLFPSGVQPPVPIVRSFWLVLHVAFTFIGEAFFVVSFVAALCSLGARDEAGRAAMDRLTATAIGIGYPVFTAGALVFGAIWAEVAWGSWWSWDPKETWALVTWLIYTAYLHTRLVRGMRGPVSAWIAIAGFAATVFTFFGVTFLMPGLHAYG